MGKNIKIEQLIKENAAAIAALREEQIKTATAYGLPSASTEPKK